MIIGNSLQWFITIEILAIISFILTFKFFNKLNDKGYCISKATGIGLTSFIGWLIMLFSNGNYTYSPTISYISIALLGIISMLFTFKLLLPEERKDLFQFIDKRYKFIIFIEALFLLILIGGTYIRGFSPDILGVNKLQEYVYIKSILLSDSLPPANLWLSGEHLNIYYFGYFIFANLINISSIDIDLAFNLIPATILGIIGIASGGIIYNITDSKIAGVIGGFITAFCSNYEALFQILENGTENGFNWWLSGHTFTNGIFTEFPFWSFLLGDIPSYVISNIFILAYIYFAYSAIANKYTLNIRKIISAENIFILMTSIILAIVGLTNIYSLFIALFLMFIIYMYHLKDSHNKIIGLKNYLINVIPTLCIISIILIPFLVKYQTPSISITSNNIFDLNQVKAFLETFGYFLIPCLLFTVIKLKETLKLTNINILFIFTYTCSAFELYLLLNKHLTTSLIPILTCLLLVIITGYFLHRSFQEQKISALHSKKGILAIICIPLVLIFLIYLYPILTLAGLLIGFSIFILSKKNDSKIFITFCILLISLITIIVGIIWNININELGPNLVNSQLLCNAVLILCLSIVPIMYYTIKKIPSQNIDLYIVSMIVIFIPCLLFTVLGTLNRTQNFKVLPDLVPMLSGSNHLKYFHSSEYYSIDWLKNNAIKGSIILESCIPDEPYSGRISSYSGLSNIINWPNKQRIAYDKSMQDEITKRVNDVNTIYSEPDKSKIVELIKKYDIKYIYIGEQEVKLYPEASLKGFNTIGNEVYKKSESPEKYSVIYKIN